LIPLAKRWCIGDDVQRIELMKLTQNNELRTLVEAVQPFDDKIWNWCSSHHDDIPVPDEVVVFDGLLQAAAEARIVLEQKR
jgi:hypothetical protein